MFIDGLTEQEKHQVAIHLREHAHTPFMVVKHAHAASQCKKRGIEVHAIDSKYLQLLDDTIAQLHNKHRQGPGLNYRVRQLRYQDLVGLAYR